MSSLADLISAHGLEGAIAALKAAGLDPEALQLTNVTATPRKLKPRGKSFASGFNPDRYRPTYRRLSKEEMALDGQPHAACPNAGFWHGNAGRFSDYMTCNGCGAILDPASLHPLQQSRGLQPKPSAAQQLQAVRQQLVAVQQMATETKAAESQPESPKAKAPVVHVPPSELLPPYPMDHAFALGDAVDAAKKEGKIESGFGLRRQVLWIRCWKALVNAKLNPDSAFRLGFALTAAERATEDERDFYCELWRARMGCDLYPIPTLPLPRDGQSWHPVSGLVMALVRESIPVWAHGDAGAGKTVMFKMIAQHLGLPYHRFQGTRQRTVDDMVGGWGFDGTKTVKRYGVVPEAMRAGAMLAIDEGSALAPDVTFEFHAVLEGEPLTILKFGEVVQAAPGFCITVSDNSVGKGERTEYVGTLPANEAYRDRFVYLRVAELPDKVRRGILTKELT